jgi:hypothetical protein
MANAFKTVTDTAVGTSPATIYTCPAATETTIIGLNVANILTTSITVDVQLENAGGDQKIVMNAADILKVTASQASAADVTLSVLEIS